MLKYELYLNDILRAIKKIEFSIKNKDEGLFCRNDDLIDAMSMRLQVIGESINKIPLKIRNQFKEVEWKRFLRARNIISHAYFAVNPKIIWSIAKKDLPKLKKEIKKMLEKEK
ncbi:DUF86 domain-containing protein [Candidatus Pacearchaeota archaeon]|nr:DUF86 domain-containing protein [Candidatus Pacearchaeota archaeon]